MSGGNKPSRRHQRSFGSELGSLEVELKRFKREGEGGEKSIFFSLKGGKKTIRRLSRGAKIRRSVTNTSFSNKGA